MIRPAPLLLAVLLMVACARPSSDRPVHVAPNAPHDQPVTTVGEPAFARLIALLEPCLRKAMAAFPDVRRRFQAGLPGRHTLFVTTRLRDARGYIEQVFVAVDRIDAARITGRLWSDLRTVEGYRRGQALTLSETDVVDWMIARPDGTEEGNWMGRFLDAYQATGRAPAGICDP